MTAVTVQLHQLIREFFRSQLEQWQGANALKQSYCRGMVGMAQQMPQTPTREQILEFTPALPHIAEAANTWQDFLADEDVGWPFTASARFYQGQGAYAQAAPWWQARLKATQNRFGDEHPNVATSLNNLADLYESQGRYGEAEPLYLQALQVFYQQLGEDHPTTQTVLNNFVAYLRRVMAAGQTQVLSDHPQTQALLEQLRQG